MEKTNGSISCLLGFPFSLYDSLLAYMKAERGSDRKKIRTVLFPIVAVFLSLGFSIISLEAATFYIDPNNGDMSNDGSYQAPWRTLQEVLENDMIETRIYETIPPSPNTPLIQRNPGAPVKAGDTILLRSGYHGDIFLRGGFNSDYITIAAQEGHTPYVRRIWLSAVSKWILRGLTVSPELDPEGLTPWPDFDKNGVVDFKDFAMFASYWEIDTCEQSDWCGGSDVDQSKTVDFSDFMSFVDNWLIQFAPEGLTPWPDFNKDGVVNFKDFAVFASYWEIDTCDQSNWCGGSDVDQSGVVDYDDLMDFADNWIRQFTKPILIFVESHRSHGASYDIVIENNNIFSVEDSSEWTTDKWNTFACVGIRVDSPNTIIRNNILRNVDFGIITGDDSLIEHNTIENIAGDGMVANADNVTIQFNTLKNFYKVDDNHDDAIQSWSLIPGEVHENIVIRGNYIVSRDIGVNNPLVGSPMGIQGTSSGGHFVNWIIENNIVLIQHYWGIYLADAADSIIVNNIVFDPTGAYNVGISLGGSCAGCDWQPNIPIETDTWTHVAFTYDGSTMVMYKNGVYAASISASGALMLADPSSDESLRIGMNTEWGTYFGGIVDELRIYNRALIASEIRDLYQPDILPPLPPTNFVSTSRTENSISLAWDAPPAAGDGDLASAYRIFRNGTQVGQVDTATFQDTGLDPNTCYDYQVYSVDDAGNQSFIGPLRTFCTAADAVPPSIVSVEASSEGSVEIVFSEGLDHASSEDVRNYTIDNGISIISASLDADLMTVKLTTSPHLKGVEYTLTVIYIEDLAGSAINETSVHYQYFELSDDLVIYMKFNEGNDIIAFDSSGRDNNGILTNGPTWTTGQVDGALSFDGIDDYVEVLDSPDFSIADEITIMAWINPVDTNNLRTIVSKFAHTPDWRKDLYWFLYDGRIGINLAGIITGGQNTILRNNMSRLSVFSGRGVVADHNIDIVDYDPNSLFVDYQNYDLRHKENSVAIDGGSADLAPETDFKGNPRPCGLGYDIGAFEYTFYSDLNDDALVSFKDFARFAEYWMVEPCYEGNKWCDGADLNQLNGVNSVDLGLFVEQWLCYCPAGSLLE